jgi:hypothetical protein
MVSKSALRISGGELIAGKEEDMLERRLGRLGLLAAFGACLCAPMPVLAQQVGVAGAVNPASKASLNGNVRVLELGSPIIHDEHLQTSAQGSLQVVFIDKTTLSLGPSSDLTIDSFVYDPQRQSGKMALTLGKGVLRLVGGAVPHTGGATIGTPVATIGIRGGIATVSHDKRSGTRAVNGYGVVTVASKGLQGGSTP